MRRISPNGQYYDYRWGPRALAECSATDIVSFMAQVYAQNKQPWLEKLGLVEVDQEVIN